MTSGRPPSGVGAGRIVAGVVREFLETAGRSGLHLIGGGPGERSLAAAWLSGLVNEAADDSPEPRLPDGAGVPRMGGGAPQAGEPWWPEETERFRARLAAQRMNGEVAHLANRTYLLLAGGRLPPERVLPLGDVAASQVLALAGTPLLPPPFHSVADDPAALDELEAAIEAWMTGGPERDGETGGETKDESGFAVTVLPAGSLAGVLQAGFLARTRDRIVPKLGQATPWIDLDI